jgi:putative transposase
LEHAGTLSLLYLRTPGLSDPCWDKLFIVPQPTRSHMHEDVARYMKYYNVDRLHSANLDQSPIEFESSFRKVSGWS